MASQMPRTVGGLEPPALSIVHSPVFARNPMFRFLGMTGDSPSPQHRIHRVVESLKDACADDVGIVRTPANDLRIEGFDQRLLLRVSMAVSRLSQGLDMPLNRCWAGGDARFEAVQTSSAIFARLGFPHGVLSDLKAEKVETRSPLSHFQRMGDPRFAWFQRSSHLMQPLCHHRLTSLHDSTILMEDDEVIGIDHDVGRLESATPTAWKPLANEGFQTM